MCVTTNSQHIDEEYPNSRSFVGKMAAEGALGFNATLQEGPQLKLEPRPRLQAPSLARQVLASDEEGKCEPAGRGTPLGAGPMQRRRIGQDLNNHEPRRDRLV